MTSTCVCIYIYIYTVIDTFYIALFWVLKALYIEGWNLFNHHQCAASTWMMRRQPYCVTTLTTHQLGVEGQFFYIYFIYYILKHITFRYRQVIGINLATGAIFVII